MAKEGWVRAYRQIQEHPSWNHDGMFKLLFFCWQEANYKSTSYLVPGTNDTIVVERGSFVTGRETLLAALYPRKTADTPVARTVYRWLQSLEQMECVTLRTLSNRCTIVTVNNYDTYNPSVIGQCPTDVRPVSDRCPTDVRPVSTSEEGNKGRREEGKKEGGSSEPEIPASKPARKLKTKITPDKPAGTFLTYPCNGDTTCWHLVQEQVDVWQDLFPAIDVAQECRNILAWCDSNPAKRKTAAGMMRCITAWLTKEQNRNTQRFEQRPSTRVVSRVATKADLESYNPNTPRD